MKEQLIKFYNWLYRFFQTYVFYSKEMDAMATATLSELEVLFTKIVNDPNEIDAIVAFDGKSGLKLVGSKGAGTAREAKTLEDRSEQITGSLSHINAVILSLNLVKNQCVVS